MERGQFTFEIELNDGFRAGWVGFQEPLIILRELAIALGIPIELRLVCQLVVIFLVHGFGRRVCPRRFLLVGGLRVADGGGPAYGACSHSPREAVEVFL